MNSTTRHPSNIFFQENQVRRSIIASYLAVILLAIPLWWYTTSIERLSLPTIELVNSATASLEPLPLNSRQDYRILPYSSRYRLSFSLLHQDATTGEYIRDWDVAGAISRHFSPIFSQLSILHNFTIESQIQFHARLAFTPCPLHQGFGVSLEDLSVFVNSAEWTLSSSASNDPVIHFVTFVPSTHRPLYILDREGLVSPSNAFLLPQWGGIVILNPLETTLHSLSSFDLDPVFSAFSKHLLALLGVPSSPPNIEGHDAEFQILTEWQLDALVRFRSLGNAHGAKNTLQSLVKLVDKIKNIPVRRDVKEDVQNALAALDEMNYNHDGTSVEKLQHSIRALFLSSRAFFNPKMLALLYFPAEHKYAIYTPMFASAFIPLLLSTFREFAAWRKNL